MTKRPRYTFIDSLRGIAALSVALFHLVAGNHINQLIERFPAAGAWIEHGYLGVAVFFVLSGFVIAASLEQLEVTPSTLVRFMARRSVRLDPPYWAAIVICIGFGLLANRFVATRTSSWSFAQLFAHVFYLQDWLGYLNVNPAFWTLCLEVQFYFVYAAMLLATRSMRTAVLGVAFMVSLLWPLGLVSIAPRACFLHLWYAFLLGVGTFAAWRNSRIVPLFACYVLIIGADSLVFKNQFALVAALTASSILIVGLANRLTTALDWRALQFLGAISYSLYLIHSPITGAVFRIGYVMTGEMMLTELLWSITAIAACIGASWILWLVIERPSMVLARRISLSSDRRIQPEQAVSFEAEVAAQ